MVELGYGPGTKISRRERIALANKIKRDPRPIYQHLELLYRNNHVSKGKEGEGRDSPVFYEILSDSIVSIRSVIELLW